MPVTQNLRRRAGAPAEVRDRLLSIGVTQHSHSTRFDSEPNVIASRHRSWHSRERSTLFVPSMPIAEALEVGRGAGVERVFVAGEPQLPTAVLREAPAGVHVFVDGHYPTIGDGAVSVHYLGQWFGDQCAAPDGAEMFEHLSAILRESWRDPRLTVFSNPAATGLDLWARTIRGKAWPVMSSASQELVRRSTGQGRIEMFPRPSSIGPAELVRLHEYDMRLAYMAGVRSLPIGEPARCGEMSSPYAAGRYLVTFEAPAELADRAGIIAVAEEGGRGGGYSWPASSPRPVWTTGEELELARRWGYRCEVLEGFEWQQSADPLRLWSERLTDLYATAGELRGALRSIMLHTIGALHGAPRRVTMTGAELPTDRAIDRARTRREGGWTWIEWRAPKNPATAHPEWTTTIWARARRRLLDNGQGAGMLHVPAGELVAARTDSYLTIAPQPIAGGTTRPGSFRLKSVSEPAPWPANSGALLATRGAGNGS